MIVQYQAGKYLNTHRIDLIDTTVNPPTVTIGGQVLPVAAPYVARIRAELDRDNQAPPAAALPVAPAPGTPPL